MKNRKVSIFILILFLATLFLSIIGMTFSYFQNTGQMTNSFQAGDYSTSATEEFVSPENWLPGDETEKTIIVKNEGDIAQGVRIKIVESWKDSNDQDIPLEVNGIKSVIINLDNTDDWERDGEYYYYKEVLDPGEETNSFIKSVTFNKSIVSEPVCTTTNGQTSCTNTYNGYENATYTLTFIIQTIQYEFMDPEWDEDKGTLYAIVRDEYRSNSGYAGLYTGSHKDSFNRDATKKIYYYTAPTATTNAQDITYGNILLNKVNVLFGGFCWQMIRTTDTGGVKMIYNGVPINGECLNTRSDTNGLIQGSRNKNISMNDSYAYGSDFTYDLNAGTFKIDGTIKENINYSSDKSVIGYYTCKNADKNATCTTLYYLQEESVTNTSPYVYPFTISSTKYGQIGTTPYNSQDNSPAYVGYMYNKIYNANNVPSTINQSFSSSKTLLSSATLNTSYYYADSVDMGNINANEYTLIDPQQWQSGVTNLAGKYMINNAQHSNNVYYIEAVDGTTILYRTLSNITITARYYYGDVYDYHETHPGNYTIHNAIQWSNGVDVTGKYVTNGEYSGNIHYVIEMVNNTIFVETLTLGIRQVYNESIIVSDSFTNNNNGSFTLNNPISVSLNDWYTNYANYNNKYTCLNSTTTCTSMKYFIETNNKGFKYVDSDKKILISKTLNGTNLTDTLVVIFDDLSKHGENYSDYKYTCNTTSSTCTEDKLRIIKAYNLDNYTYAPNRYFGESVTWNGTKYILNNALKTVDISNITDIFTHHYICIDPIGTECTNVGYIYYYDGTGAFYYILLENGVETVSKALDEMLYDNNVNVKDSAIKRLIEKWYYNNLTEYDSYLEETIYCNDRSIRDLGGWKADGGMTNQELQLSLLREGNDLSCSNETDKFSVSNNKAKIKYKIGLLSRLEEELLNNNTVRKIDASYWVITPRRFGASSSFNSNVRNNGLTYSYYVYGSYGARPSISLIPGIAPASGTGTMTDPYVVDTSGI